MNAISESSPHRQIFRYPFQHRGIKYIQHFIIRFSPHILNKRAKFFKLRMVFACISLCHRDIYGEYREYMEQNMRKFFFMLPVFSFIFRKPCYIGTAKLFLIHAALPTFTKPSARISCAFLSVSACAPAIHRQEFLQHLQIHGHQIHTHGRNTAFHSPPHTPLQDNNTQ